MLASKSDGLEILKWRKRNWENNPVKKEEIPKMTCSIIVAGIEIMTAFYGYKPSG